jgi:septum formation protein
MPRLVLASTSPYRQQLLSRLRLPFDVVAPHVDETPLPGEHPQALARRLAAAKADAVCAIAPDAWVIGSDQVAELAGRALGKPGSRDAAIAQLTSMSGEEVRFRTAISIAHAVHGRHDEEDVTTVRFRALRSDEITRYVDAEQPFDCAGSFKSEGFGIALFDAIVSTDPTALVGLPLIATARLLRRAGFTLP